MNGFYYAGKFVELRRRGQKKIDWPGCQMFPEMTEELCLEVMNVRSGCNLCNVRRRELSRTYKVRVKARKSAE